MTRIIAGAIGSLQLKQAAKATRPTSDRVKESLFASLDSLDVLEHAVVLDLFAGTGALGIEAASRGAKQVDFVERDKSAFLLLRENIEKARFALGKQGISPVFNSIPGDAKKFLTLSQRRFDLAFVDPPYEMSDVDLSLLLTRLLPSMSKESWVIVERSARDPQPTDDGLSLYSAKNYGDTSVYLFNVLS